MAGLRKSRNIDLARVACRGRCVAEKGTGCQKSGKWGDGGPGYILYGGG